MRTSRYFIWPPGLERGLKVAHFPPSLPVLWATYFLCSASAERTPSSACTIFRCIGNSNCALPCLGSRFNLSSPGIDIRSIFPGLWIRARLGNACWNQTGEHFDLVSYLVFLTSFFLPRFSYLVSSLDQLQEKMTSKTNSKPQIREYDM